MMAKGFRRFVERVLTITSQQLSLCCHRQVGNIPSEMLRPDQARSRGLN